jgi:hypothetical protein
MKAQRFIRSAKSFEIRGNCPPFAVWETLPASPDQDEKARYRMQSSVAKIVTNGLPPNDLPALHFSGSAFFWFGLLE